MQKIAEEFIAERVISEVLDGASAVGVGVCLPKLRGGQARVTRQQQRFHRRLPGKIYKLLMTLDGVGRCTVRDQQHNAQEQKEPQQTKWLCVGIALHLHGKSVSGFARRREFFLDCI